MSRYFPSPPAGGRDRSTVILIAIAAGVIVGTLLWGGSDVDIRILLDRPTPTATATPTPTSTPAPTPSAYPATQPATRPNTFPPTETLIRHYFDPLGATQTALAVHRCESGPAPYTDGAAGEQGPFQLHPKGAAAPFLAAGWNLRDPRENIIAAALIVAADGWGAWSACLP